MHGKLLNARDAAAALVAGRLFSAPGNGAAEELVLSVTNTTDDDATFLLCFVDASGRFHHFRPIAPGHTHRENTAAGHIFVILLESAYPQRPTEDRTGGEAPPPTNSSLIPPDAIVAAYEPLEPLLACQPLSQAEPSAARPHELIIAHTIVAGVPQSLLPLAASPTYHVHAVGLTREDQLKAAMARLDHEGGGDIDLLVKIITKIVGNPQGIHCTRTPTTPYVPPINKTDQPL